MSDWYDDDFATEDDIGLDVGDVDQDVTEGGDSVDKEGWYHFEVAQVKGDLEPVNKNGRPKAKYILFVLQVLHSAPGQSPKGSRHYHKVFLSQSNGGPPKDGSVKSAVRFGAGLGVLVKGKKSGWVDAETGSARVSMATWERAVGEQIIAKIAFKKGEGDFSDSHEIPYGRVYAADDPDYAHVPRDEAALNAWLGAKGRTPRKLQQPTEEPRKPRADREAGRSSGQPTRGEQSIDDILGQA